MELSVVIPCYNEEESIRELHKRVNAVCSSAPVSSYEIVLINDGSRDSTPEIMRELVKADPHLVIVDLSRNHGHQLALTAGLFHAQGDYVLVLDADLQDPPELLLPMLERARSGVDVVYGKRDQREGETLFKRVSASLFYRLLSYLSDTHIPRDVGDFRLMSRRVVEQFKDMPEQHRFVRGMIAWIGFRQEAFSYKRAPRFAGETKYPFHKLIAFAFDAISSFSIKPLRVSLLFAGFGVLLATLMAVYAIYAHFTDRNLVTGWASLATIIAFFASLQLVCIGVIGEYIGRTYIQVKNRPLFIIREVLRGSA
ncbi:MAG: glycosyltransferase family 2 protein [Micavibrio aeruginosavorus]|uniref:Glycosyltransferase family 2 protein n=1 Tax=Micavibrio aeruginosavorus TaxID=349221 RepID=A0A7T5R177_9BACT|nr:MAG: glycosyltransferase family 2 protein [Micavibrio aeruginosavorus]